YRTMWVEPVTLVGENVRLEPLELAHAEALYLAGQHPRIWDYMPVDPSASVASMRAWIAEALAAREASTQMPFAIFERATNAIPGSTRYLDISAHDRNLEIGWTWLTPAAQRTAVNTECKYLLLRHAFETLGAIRVQLKTDRRNETSQRAIERLGAVREGILRKQRIVRDGYQRDSVMYSITDDEWPAVKAGLEAKLRRS
ncbi:MAG TPA: GNAT family protein, partial [Ktedonobacterales bacterium]|nr:GNAT family protein [Ktedonobacterales bacterium]